jgi:hypothetical protein
MEAGIANHVWTLEEMLVYCLDFEVIAAQFWSVRRHYYEHIP